MKWVTYSSRSAKRGGFYEKRGFFGGEIGEGISFRIMFFSGYCILEFGIGDVAVYDSIFLDAVKLFCRQRWLSGLVDGCFLKNYWLLFSSLS